MLSVFSLKAAVNESVGAFNDVSSVPAYEFIGEMDESVFAEFNHVVVSEAANIFEFIGAADEAMVESVISTNDTGRQDVLVENVFTQIIEAAKKFIDKIIAMVKGLINKLKAFFFKISGKTDKWVSVMKDPINKSKSKNGASDFKATMHAWDEDFIMNKMIGAADFLLSNTDKVSKKDIKKEISNAAAEVRQFKNVDPQDQKIKNYVKDLDDIIENNKKAAEETRDAIIDEVSQKLGVTASAADILWREVEKKATGDEKVEQALYSKVDSMLSVVENSKKSIEKLQKAYEKHLNVLNDYKKTIDNVDKDLKDVDKVPASVLTPAKNCINSYITTITDEIKSVETVVNTLRSKNIKYVQSMVSEYMTVLTKFAGVREKKDK